MTLKKPHRLKNIRGLSPYFSFYPNLLLYSTVSCHHKIASQSALAHTCLGGPRAHGAALPSPITTTREQITSTFTKHA